MTLNDISIADRASPELARQSIKLGTEQPPIAFQLNIERDKLNPKMRYAVRGIINDPDGELMWMTDTAHIIDPTADNNNLDKLMLIRIASSENLTAEESAGDTQLYQCGALQVSVRLIDDSLELTTHNKTYMLSHVRSASGAKYESSANAEQVIFWNKGDKALLEIDGKTYPECIEHNNVNQATELTSGEWVVEDLGGKGVIDFARTSLTFGGDGTVSGLATCNTYSGPYEVNGSTLTFGVLAVTRKACPPAVMNQEKAFLKVLEDAIHYEITDTNALIIKTNSGDSLTARQ